MEEKFGIVFTAKDIIRITMIVTDEDKDGALAMLTEIEKKLHKDEQGKLNPKSMGGAV